MSDRTYQKGLYSRCRKLRDFESRLEQAEKISFVLSRFSENSLSGSKALDIGCADGSITSSLAPQFSHIIGIEYDRTALRNTDPLRLENPAFIQGDALLLPFPDTSFDVIICAQVYEHVPDDTALFAEIARVLKPGGIVFFSGPNFLFPIEPHYGLPFLHWLPTRLAGFYLRLTRRGDQFYEHSRTIWGLRRVLKDFTITDVTIQVLIGKLEKKNHQFRSRFILAIPSLIWRVILPFLPNYNWLLRKIESERIVDIDPHNDLPAFK